MALVGGNYKLESRSVDLTIEGGVPTGGSYPTAILLDPNSYGLFYIPVSTANDFTVEISIDSSLYSTPDDGNAGSVIYIIVKNTSGSTRTISFSTGLQCSSGDYQISNGKQQTIICTLINGVYETAKLTN